MAREISTTEELESRVAEGVVVLKCMSTQCLRCPAVGILLTMLQSSHTFKIVNCDVHNVDQDLYEVLQVTQLPTLIIYKEGVEVAREIGIWEANKIKKLINANCPVTLAVDDEF